MSSLAPGWQNLAQNLPKKEMATAKLSFPGSAPSLVARWKPTWRLHQQCLVCVTGGSVRRSLKLRADMRANWWRFQGGLNSNQQPSTFLSFFRPRHRYSELQTLAIERGTEGSSSEVALSTSSNGQDVKVKIQKNRDDDDGDDGDVGDGMECIGTGLDVECVVPLKTLDAKAPGQFAGRAVNSNGMGEKEGGDGEAGLLKSVLETLLLISPFFFWGTAMVAMKGILPKAGPMFVASTRLIPAGALLVAFARYTSFSSQ